MSVAVGRAGNVAAGRLEFLVGGIDYPLGGGGQCCDDDRRLAERLAVTGVLAAGVIVLRDLGLLEIALVVVRVGVEGARFAMRIAGQRGITLQRPAEGDEQRYEKSRRPAPPRDGQ